MKYSRRVKLHKNYHLAPSQVRRSTWPADDMDLPLGIGLGAEAMRTGMKVFLKNEVKGQI